MSRSQALSLKCAEPEGKSRHVQIQSFAATSVPVLCEAPAPQGLLPPSHHIQEVGCSISTRDWETSARTVPCSTRDFACGHRRQDRRRGAAPFRGDFSKVGDTKQRQGHSSLKDHHLASLAKSTLRKWDLTSDKKTDGPSRVPVPSPSTRSAGCSDGSCRNPLSPGGSQSLGQTQDHVLLGHTRLLEQDFAWPPERPRGFP
ncbi:uncharacterized protein LOC123329917 isoform X2 [Bubalus bubalis]|nr:uncharacterized protein LOC123329917 isoform X2 [Bubalus bubalis]